MSFLLRLLRAVVSLRAPASEEAAAPPPVEARREVAKPAAPREPRALMTCSLKLRPLNKSQEVRAVNRGAFTRVIVNTKERVRLIGGFDKDAPGVKVLSKEPLPADFPVRDLRARTAPAKRRPALVLLPGGGADDGPRRGDLREASYDAPADKEAPGEEDDE